jgi:glutaredoxin
MSKYYLHAVVLEGCPYSNNAVKLLNNYNNIKKNITTIQYNEKEKFKTNEINTFPQIYLKKNNSNGNLLLGGYSELKDFVDNFQNKKYDENSLNNFINKNNKWSKKATLRLIELINLK